jgi:hypothetical protein
VGRPDRLFIQDALAAIDGEAAAATKEGQPVAEVPGEHPLEVFIEDRKRPS